MYKFKATYQTVNTTPGINTDQFIILHHTGNTGLQGNLNALLGKTTRPVSVHFVIATNGDAYKLAWPKEITWHAGESKRWELNWMNKYSLGIEIVGPDKAGGFPQVQYDRVVDLVKYLMTTFKIPVDNVLKHADITRVWAKDKKLWDGKTVNRKTDVNRALRAARGFKTFDDRRHKVLS